MNKEKIKYLYKLAFTDLLTGLKNRNAYEEKLKVYRKQPKLLAGVSAVVIDIDGLKQINDTYGHHSGDEAIRTVGDCIIKAFGNDDFCCRNGGDEFVCFVYGNIPQKVFDFKRYVDVKNHDALYPLIVSIGYAYFDKNNDMTVDGLIKRCDKLMYIDKRHE